jgi:hypothetical protein
MEVPGDFRVSLIDRADKDDAFPFAQSSEFVFHAVMNRKGSGLRNKDDRDVAS